MLLLFGGVSIAFVGVDWATVGVMASIWFVIFIIYTLIIVRNRQILEDRFDKEKADLHKKFEDVLAGQKSMLTKLGDEVVNLHGQQMDVYGQQVVDKVNQAGKESVQAIQEIQRGVTNAIQGTLSVTPSARANKEIAKSQAEREVKGAQASQAIHALANNDGATNLLMRIEMLKEQGIVKTGGFWDKVQGAVGLVAETGGLGALKDDLDSLRTQLEQELGGTNGNRGRVGSSSTIGYLTAGR